MGKRGSVKLIQRSNPDRAKVFYDGPMKFRGECANCHMARNVHCARCRACPGYHDSDCMLSYASGFFH